MNLSSKLGRTYAKRGLRPIAGVGIVGLVVAGFRHLSTSNSQSVNRTNDLPLVPPIVISDRISEQADLSQTAEIGLQDSKTQLIAAKAEVSKLGCKPNSVAEM